MQVLYNSDPNRKDSGQNIPIQCMAFSFFGCQTISVGDTGCLQESAVVLYISWTILPTRPLLSRPAMKGVGTYGGDVDGHQTVLMFLPLLFDTLVVLQDKNCYF